MGLLGSVLSAWRIEPRCTGDRNPMAEKTRVTHEQTNNWTLELQVLSMTDTNLWLKDGQKMYAMYIKNPKECKEYTSNIKQYSNIQQYKSWASNMQTALPCQGDSASVCSLGTVHPNQLKLPKPSGRCKQWGLWSLAQVTGCGGIKNMKVSVGFSRMLKSFEVGWASSTTSNFFQALQIAFKKNK